jgi:hypothetical protein
VLKTAAATLVPGQYHDKHIDINTALNKTLMKPGSALVSILMAVSAIAYIVFYADILWEFSGSSVNTMKTLLLVAMGSGVLAAVLVAFVFNVSERLATISLILFAVCVGTVVYIAYNTLSGAEKAKIEYFKTHKR